jgi:hypothetical protein
MIKINGGGRRGAISEQGGATGKEEDAEAGAQDSNGRGIGILMNSMAC